MNLISDLRLAFPVNQQKGMRGSLTLFITFISYKLLTCDAIQDDDVNQIHIDRIMISILHV